MTCQYGIIPLHRPLHRYSLAFFYAVGAVTSGSLNFLVLLSIQKTPSLHRPSYIILATIALADFFAGFFGGIMLAISSIFISAVRENRSRSWLALNCKLITACRAYGFIVCGASISSLTAMSVDRLMAITMKTRYNNNSTVFKAMGFCILLCWLVIISLSSYFPVNLTFEKIKPVFLISGTILTTSLFIIVICYTVAYSKLKKLSSSAVAPNNPGNLNINLEKYRKTLNTFVLVCVFLLVCYTPYIVVSFILFSNGLEKLTDQAIFTFMFFDISELLVYCSATGNPILYVWRMRELRNAIKTVVKRVFSVFRNEAVDINN